MSYQNVGSSDRAGLLAGLRSQAGSAAASNTGYNRMQMQAEQLQMAQVQASQAQYLAQQRDLWELHQAQMSLQLQAMKLQNLEIQERILAASTQQPAAPQHNRRPVSASYADMNSIGLPVEADEESRQQRRGALNNLQRAQMHRSVEPVPVAGAAGGRRYPGSRLSFNADALAEAAIARKNAASPVSSESSKRAASVTPPAVEQQNPFPRHHRKSSSLGSFASDHSVTLSDTRKLLTSPSGPTLVLSQPGEQFPASPPSLVGRSLPVRPLAVSISRSAEHVKEDSSGSSSPDSESGNSSTSEVHSFESVTSVGSELANPKKRTASSAGGGGMVKSSSDGNIMRHAISSNRLNAAAPTFTPTRNFSTPASMMAPVVLPGAIAIRQPRGPAREGEMDAKNFAGRIRKRAFKATALKLKNRAGTNSAPPSPVTLQDPTFQF